MEDKGQSPPVLLTAQNLEEPNFPTFPFPKTTPEASQRTSHDTELKAAGTETSRTNDVEQKAASVHNDAEHDTRKPAHLPRMQTEINADRPPMAQTSQTERPRPWKKTSRFAGSFAKKRDTPRQKPKPVQRQPTVTFNEGDSDSSSSSSDEDDETDVHRPHEHYLPTRTSRNASNAAEDDERKYNSSAKRQARRGPFSGFHISHDDFQTKGHVSKRDGRLKLHINETVNRGYFAKTLGAGLKKHIKVKDNEDGENGAPDANAQKSSVAWQDEKGRKILPENDPMEDASTRVKLNIVIIVIGSRGDIQPFLRIGMILKNDYGHRVRIATHPAFREFVQKDTGLEFFSVGGDPSELMAFMVKNPGLIPSMETIKEGEIGRRRKSMEEMFQGMWRACVNATDDEGDEQNLKMMGHRDPFVADAIIANPPSFAPPHIAERLGIPLHMMFTFPYSPTVQFPHPLANIKKSNVDANYTNFMSYPLVEMMTWQGLGDLINRFRSKSLHLDEVSTLWAPGQLYRLKVPYTYMWSPGLVPKPKDWGPEIDISGFVFLDLASSFKPPQDLVDFLDAGDAPVYIGFGSIVVDDPDGFTELIFEAIKQAGVRALVSKGWGGFGGKKEAPEGVFMLENTPHDWLFPRVTAVVHHGGAGTTAAGLKCAKPTMIVPFFGDQPFWGAMVSKAKAGAHECVPYKKLTAEKLAEGIKQCLTDEARKNVKKIADSIEAEGDGALNAVRSFHRSLPLKGENTMSCQILPNRCAAWKLKGSELRLSPLAAELLVEWKKIKWNELRLLRMYEWNDFGGPGEPVTGMWGAIVGTADDVFKGVGLVPVKMAKSVKKREKYYKKQYKAKKKREHAASRTKTNNTTNNTTNSTTDGTTTKSKVPTNSSTTKNRPSTLSHQESVISTISVPEEYLVEEFAHEAGHGFKKAGLALFKSPLTISLALTQGFHNAPRLYGDETVRRPHRITGFHSGLRAGRDEFVYGLQDGVTGLWRLPIKGAKGGLGGPGRKGGVLGALRGVGMGVGGLVLKDIAAVVGPWAYLLKGVEEERRKGAGPTAYLRKARICQGRVEVAELVGKGVKTVAQMDSRKPTAVGKKGSRTPSTDGAEDRKENRDVAKGKDDPDNRREIEIAVSKQWEVLQPQILAERKLHKSGIRAALLGTSQHNEGTAVPRKQSAPGLVGWGQYTGGVGDVVANGGPKKTKSAPINGTLVDGADEGWEEDEDEDEDETLLNGNGNGNGEAKVNGNGHGNAEGNGANGDKATRRDSAPSAVFGWKNRASKRSAKRAGLEGVSLAVREEANGR